MSKDSEVWKDPVWSKVIAVTIVAIAASVGSYFLNWWPFFATSLKRAVTFLVARTSAPNWLLLSGGTLIALTALSRGISVFNAEKKGAEPTWEDFTQGRFEGLLWYWEYLDSTIISLTACCPKCKCQLREHYGVTTKKGQYGGKLEWNYMCEACKKTVLVLDGDPDNLKQTVRRLIGQKLRSGDWKKALTP